MAKINLWPLSEPLDNTFTRVNALGELSNPDAQLSKKVIISFWIIRSGTFTPAQRLCGIKSVTLALFYV